MARTITPATIQARPAFFFGLNLRFGSAAAVATTPDVGKRDLHLGQVTMPSSSSGDGAAEMRAPQPGQKTFIGTTSAFDLDALPKGDMAGDLFGGILWGRIIPGGIGILLAAD